MQRHVDLRCESSDRPEEDRKREREKLFWLNLFLLYFVADEVLAENHIKNWVRILLYLV